MISLSPKKNYNCLLSAFEMAINRPIPMDHDGGEIIWPDLEEPQCYRGFHIQEITDALWRMGVYVITIHAKPLSVPDLKHKPYILPIDYQTRMANYLMNNKGVLTGVDMHQKRHAVYWDQHVINDTNGKRYPITLFNIEVFYILLSAKTLIEENKLYGYGT